MTEAQEKARGIIVGDFEFDHPEMIRARRMWAELLRRGGELEPGDEELVKFFYVESIRDRLMADIINPYAWDEAEYMDLFRGALQPDADMIDRMKAATQACRNLSEVTPTADHPPMLLITAMCQWLTLNLALAGTGAAIALKIDPDYQLAHLMLKMAKSGLKPDWANNLDC